MKFLVDAQLPLRLARFLREAGHDVLHTRELPDKNATSDAEILRISMAQQRVVVTKDLDFLESFLVRQQPYKLLLLTTGNIRNSDLAALFQNNLELSKTTVIVYQ